MLLILLAKWRPILLATIMLLSLLTLHTYTTHRSLTYHSLQQQNLLASSQQSQTQSHPDESGTSKVNWKTITQDYPVESLIPLPESNPNSIPKIQHVFEKESREEKKERRKRLDAVRGSFSHAFEGYRAQAWGKEGVGPVSGEVVDGERFGWGGGVVEVLDTLWIMDLKEEFDEAVKEIANIDFSTSSQDTIPLSLATTRYLGALLSAYDISAHLYPELLSKAEELGEMLYKAFDTPNRFPVMDWNSRNAMEGGKQEASVNVSVAEVGSLTLEFTRLSQLTGEDKWFDAVQRVMDFFEEEQGRTKLVGMWPQSVDLRKGNFDGGNFGLGAMEGGLYEYLPKQYMLLGGGSQQYRRLYEYSMTAMKRNIFYLPMTRDNLDILLAGQVVTDGKTPVDEIVTEAHAQHVGCFAGGMVAVGAKIFDNNLDLEIGRQLVEGCLWAYEIMPLGIMPETIHTVPCEGKTKCEWDEKKWHHAVSASYEGPQSATEKIKLHGLGPGVAKVDDARYNLRPEAIESIFILYRITGDPRLRERAWTMFNTITKYTTTDIAHAALGDITVANTPKADCMDCFWMTQTLKYFYLIFEDPSVVSLDDYVFNTEAHPLRRPG